MTTKKSETKDGRIRVSDLPYGVRTITSNIKIDTLHTFLERKCFVDESYSNQDGKNIICRRCYVDYFSSAKSTNASNEQ